MILPIHVYGSSFLTELTERVEEDSEALQQLIDDMIETMHAAAGIGLAAPQVGRRERLFVVDVTPMIEEDEEPEHLPAGPLVFINPEIVEESEAESEFEEGCLSIPDLREYVVRPQKVWLHYQDRAFQQQELEVDGLLSRVIQHEYDHLEGILFVDRISAFRRRLLRRRLRDMAKGEVEADYPLYVEGSSP